MAGRLAAEHPDRLTTAARKQDRGHRLYLDIPRNAYTQTAVAPFTVRARPGAPSPCRSPGSSSTPRTCPRRWTIANAADQARARPWSGMTVRPDVLSGSAWRR